MNRVRSGTHLTQVGNVWYYLRAVPEDVRDVFGVTKVKKSLDTSNHIEARRLEKSHDIEFEEKLAKARNFDADGYSRDQTARVEELADQVMLTATEDGIDIDEALLIVPEADRDAVNRGIDGYEDEADKKDTDLELLFADLKRVLPITDDWDRVRPGIVAAVKTYYDGLKDEHSIQWARGQWEKAGNRPQQTLDEAERYIDDFMDFTHQRALAGVRRPHLLAWRDELESAAHRRHRPSSAVRRGSCHRRASTTGWRSSRRSCAPAGAMPKCSRRTSRRSTSSSLRAAGHLGRRSTCLNRSVCSNRGRVRHGWSCST
jgi:hypothetical protein